MSKINRHPVRRTAAGVLAGALALSGAVATALPANAAPGFGLERIAGENRYETSARIAAEFGVTSGAILASGETGHVVDALSANFLAGVRMQPVLLTTRDSVPASIMARLNALTGEKRVTIVGGTAAVSTAVENSLRSMGFTVERLAGEDRYATSEAIIRAGASAASPVGLVASGTSFPDALAGGPLAYKGKHPVFLTSGGGLPQDTLDAMVAAGTRQVIILGGTSAVSASVEAALAARGITVVTRLGGAGRSETSQIIANYLIANFGFTTTTFNVASGTPRGEGADALSGAALSGKENRVLLITDSTTSAAPVVEFANARENTLTAVGDVFGGPAAIAETLVTAVEDAGDDGSQFETLDVTPDDAVTLQLADEDPLGTAAVRNADNRTYTVTGLDDALTYRVTLINAASIQGTGAGRTFLSSAVDGSTTAFAVNTGADIADIVRINGGTPVFETGDTEARTTTARPVNGNLTFEIDGQAPGTVVPAVYVNGAAGGTATTGGTSPRLETSATAAGGFGTVTETFGLGGPTTFVNPAAASQTFTAARAVDTVSKGTNQLDAGGFTFTYDANDTFFVDGVPASLEQFEAALSRQDSFTAEYSATATVSSTLRLADEGPDAPGAIDPSSGTGASSNDITVTVPVTGDADSIVIQRASVTGGTDGTTDGTVGTYATVTTVNVTAADVAAGAVTFTDQDVAAGVYRYRAAVVSDGQQSGFSVEGAAANEEATAPAADTTSPQAAATTRITDAGFAGILDANDVFTVRTNDDALAAPAAGSTIRIQDADGTVVDLVCGTSATCALNATANPTTPTGPNAGAAANTVLTVTVTAAATAVTGGTTAGLQYNVATITNTSGITDVAGNRFDISLGDRVIDPADSTGPAFTSATPANAATAVAITVSPSATYGETLASTSTATLVNETADPDAAVAGTVTVSGDTITFDPTADLSAATRYTATFSARDTNGNVTTTTVGFTTA